MYGLPKNEGGRSVRPIDTLDPESRRSSRQDRDNECAPPCTERILGRVNYGERAQPGNGGGGEEQQIPGKEQFNVDIEWRKAVVGNSDQRISARLIGIAGAKFRIVYGRHGSSHRSAR